MSRKSAISNNRARMPGTAAEVDAWRRRFGPDVRVNHAVEGDLEVGRPTVDRASMDANQWLLFLKTGELPAGAAP